MLHPARIPALALAAYLCAPAGAALADAAPADTSQLGRMESYLDRLAAFGFSGQVLVAEHGKVVLERASGWADRRFHVPMTAESQLAIGSVSKSFVAAALVKLEGQGRVRLSDRLADRLPGVPVDKAGITLAQLLSHTGGIARDIPDGLDESSRDEVVRAILAESLAHAPGERFEYSNAGFDLLAAVVERVTGTGMDEYARRELFPAAGMTASGIAGASALPAGPAAAGYNEWKEVARWRDWPHGWSGTGSGRMISSARDLWHWAEALRGGRVLGAQGWTLMGSRHASEDANSGYGYGMWVSTIAGGRTLQLLGGDVPGYRAECRIYPELDRVIVVMTNQDIFGLGTQRRTIANTLSRLAQGLAPPLPPEVAPASDSRTDSIEGAWRLAGGGRIEIWREDGQLRLGARGQDAVDLFEPADSSARARRRELWRLTGTITRDVARGDSTATLAALPRAQYDFAMPFLRQRVRALAHVYERLAEVTGLGVIGLPWDDATWRSYVRLHFLDHDVPVFLGWQGAKLYDVTFDEDRPFPVLLPVAPLAEGGYAAFEMVQHRATRFHLERAADGTPRLAIPAGGGEVTAERLP